MCLELSGIVRAFKQPGRRDSYVEANTKRSRICTSVQSRGARWPMCKRMRELATVANNMRAVEGALSPALAQSTKGASVATRTAWEVIAATTTSPCRLYVTSETTTAGLACSAKRSR